MSDGLGYPAKSQPEVRGTIDRSGNRIKFLPFRLRGNRSRQPPFFLANRSFLVAETECQRWRRYACPVAPEERLNRWLGTPNNNVFPLEAQVQHIKNVQFPFNVRGGIEPHIIHRDKPYRRRYLHARPKVWRSTTSLALFAGGSSSIGISGSKKVGV